MSSTPFIIPVFIPQAGCRHQCVFCNQETITGNLRQNDVQLAREQARQTVREYLAFKPQNDRKVELAFFGGNFLGISQGQIVWYLDLARNLYQTGQINCLRFSTRPDTVNPQTLALLQNIPVSVIEIGAQSMHNEVLHKAGRGHTAQDTERALALLHEHGFAAGVQMMVGLPGDGLPGALESGRRLAALKPVCVRIYPTLVLKGSPLAHMYLNGQYRPLSLKRAVGVTAQLYRLFTRKNIKVIRMGLQATADLQPGKTILAGPYHPAFGHMVVSRLFLKAMQSVMTASPANGAVTVCVHTSQISHVRGIGNANVKALQARWPHLKFYFKANEVLSKTEVTVNDQVCDIIG